MGLGGGSYGGADSGLESSMLVYALLWWGWFEYGCARSDTESIEEVAVSNEPPGEWHPGGDDSAVSCFPKARMVLWHSPSFSLAATSSLS